MMSPEDFEAYVRDLKLRAHGKWTDILKALGVDEKILNRRNQPCPMCGGADRFRYTDKFGEGDYYCHSCGPGGGLKLAQGVLRLSFGELLKRLEGLVGTVRTLPAPAPSGPSPERMKQLAKRIWGEAKPITTGDEVDRYLRNRGLQLRDYPRTLRCHPALGFYEKDGGTGKSKKVGEYPAMLACIQGPDGHGITLHRTYLKDGRKAFGRDSKKVLSSGINGAAVRLFEPADELAITEGIETALAVHLSTDKPVWAAISAGNMEKLWVPETVRRVCIYADNDADSRFDGQAAAYALARRLTKDAKRSGPIDVSVFVPRHSGADWADVHLLRLAHREKAA